MVAFDAHLRDLDHILSDFGYTRRTKSISRVAKRLNAPPMAPCQTDGWVTSIQGIRKGHR